MAPEELLIDPDTKTTKCFSRMRHFEIFGAYSVLSYLPNDPIYHDPTKRHTLYIMILHRY
jgi:hypothetical protein